MGALMAPKDFRENALNEDINGTIVDTVKAPDTGEWETGIQKKGENWVIVEHYGSDKTKAERGHEKWVESVKQDPTQEFGDCEDIEYDF